MNTIFYHFLFLTAIPVWADCASIVWKFVLVVSNWWMFTTTCRKCLVVSIFATIHCRYGFTSEPKACPNVIKHCPFSWFLKLECAGYKVLDSADRNNNVIIVLVLLEKLSLPKFKSPSLGRCNSQSSGWLNGKDPCVADGVVISSSTYTLFIDS